MRRAVLVLGSTVAGLAALFSYKTHVAGVAVASTSPAVTASPTAVERQLARRRASASPSPSKTAKKPAPKPSHRRPRTATSDGRTPASDARRPRPPQRADDKRAPAKPSGTFTGPTENTQYGPVQVQITVSQREDHQRQRQPAAGRRLDRRRTPSRS